MGTTCRDRVGIAVSWVATVLIGGALACGLSLFATHAAHGQSSKPAQADSRRVHVESPMGATAAGSLSDPQRGSGAARASGAQSAGAFAPAGGNLGGAVGADFTSLIQLIESTVAPDTWANTGEGTGAIQAFPTGVFVDARHALRGARSESAVGDVRAALPLPLSRLPHGPAQHTSHQRYVSLVELERHCQWYTEQGLPWTDEMLTLAGLQRVDRVLIDREHRDVILAGPAGPWEEQAEGVWVSRVDQRPVLNLTSLIVLLREITWGGHPLVCSINPRAENLARVQDYVTKSQATPLPPGGQRRWLAELRAAVGDQDVVLQGIDRETHVANVLFQADHHMKQIGMGLVPSVKNVPSYLDLVRQDKNGAPPSLEVLRWWFAYGADPVVHDADYSVFVLPRQAVRCLSENELLTLQGQRVHTGASERLNQQFAANFTQHFRELSERYPIYAELEQIFELGMVAGILREHQVPRELQWAMTSWRQRETDSKPVPETVPSIVNAKTLKRGVLLAGVSGGALVDRSVTLERSAEVHSGPRPQLRHWWADAESLVGSANTTPTTFSATTATTTTSTALPR